jgi:hypothetical protein
MQLRCAKVYTKVPLSPSPTIPPNLEDIRVATGEETGVEDLHSLDPT